MNNELHIVNTRVKKYKKYRRIIKNDYSSYVKKNSRNDDIKDIEKIISKIDKNLLINDKNKEIFHSSFETTWRDIDKTIVPIKNYLENIRNCNFTELLNKANSIKNEDDLEPHFDTQGNMSSIWLDDDTKYSDLLELKVWIEKMIENKTLIINNTKETIFSFKDAFYKSVDSSTIHNILPSKTQEVKFKINKKNKVIYWIIAASFFVCILIAFIFLILFFVS